jgi:nucleoid-associated protein YgaU
VSPPASPPSKHDVPDRPATVGTAPPALVDGTGAFTPAPRTLPADDAVVVVRGDTLWDIAARALGAGATPERIAAEWPRWYAANRAVVGADPDRVLPGQRLVPPVPGAAR